MTCGRVRPRGAPLFQDSVVTDLAMAHLRGASSEHRQGPAATRWQAVVGEAPAWSLLPGDTEHSSQAQGEGSGSRAPVGRERVQPVRTWVRTCHGFPEPHPAHQPIPQGCPPHGEDLYHIPEHSLGALLVHQSPGPGAMSVDAEQRGLGWYAQGQRDPGGA